LESKVFAAVEIVKLITSKIEVPEPSEASASRLCQWEGGMAGLPPPPTTPGSASVLTVNA